MKCTVITWYSYYDVFCQVSRELKDFDIKVFPARALEKTSESCEEALREARTSDLLLVYRSSQEAFWELLEREIRASRIKAHIVYLSHDPALWTLSTVGPEVVAKAYRYVILNGRENIANLFRFLASEVLGLGVPYEEPKEMPWVGGYHPRAQVPFGDVTEYLAWHPLRDAPTVGILFPRHSWVSGNLELEDLLVEVLEQMGFNVIAVFAYSIKDEALGTRAIGDVIRQWFVDPSGRPRIDLLVKLTPFPIGSYARKGGQLEEPEEGVELLKGLNVPVLAPVSSYYLSAEEWERGDPLLEMGWAIVLPEFEGVIEPLIVAAQSTDGQGRKVPIRERVEKLARRIYGWIELRRTPPSSRRIAFVLHNSPCASVEATVGSAAHLDSLESVVEVMKRLKEQGYRVEPPESGKALLKEIMHRKAVSEFRWTTVEEIVRKGGALDLVPVELYMKWFEELPEAVRKRMVEAWGHPPGEYKDGIPPAMVYEGKIVVTGVRFGNVVVCVQPKRGCAGSRCDGQVCKILHDPDVPPPHQYFATYRWLTRCFRAHALIHVGTHGNLEFLPGKGIALGPSCFPDIMVDAVPHLYIYNADNPSEGIIAKRRSYAVLIDHMQTTMTGSGLYGELEDLERLLEEYEEAKRKDPMRRHVLEHLIVSAARKAKLDKALKVMCCDGPKAPSEVFEGEFSARTFDEVVRALHSHLSLIRNTQIPDGMHVFGRIPEGRRKAELIYTILKHEGGEGVNLRREIAKLLGYNFDRLLEAPDEVDPGTGKSYGAVLEQIDEIGKEFVARVLGLTGLLQAFKERQGRLTDAG